MGQSLIYPRDKEGDDGSLQGVKRRFSYRKVLKNGRFWQFLVGIQAKKRINTWILASGSPMRLASFSRANTSG